MRWLVKSRNKYRRVQTVNWIEMREDKSSNLFWLRGEEANRLIGIRHPPE